MTTRSMILVVVLFLFAGRRSPRTTLAEHGRRSGHREIPECDLRAGMAGQREAQGRNGEEPYPDAPPEPADAAGLHRQSCRNCCQQDVRMRIGAVMMCERVRLLKFASIGSRMGRALALALALAAFIDQDAYAQQSTQQPKTTKQPAAAKLAKPVPASVQMTIEPRRSKS